MSRLLPRLAIASMTSLFALTAVTAPAQARTTASDQAYRCAYPAVGTQPTNISWTVEALDPITAADTIKVSASVDTEEPDGGVLQVLAGLSRLEGQLVADLDVIFADGTKRAVQVKRPITSTPEPGGTAPLLAFTAAGEFSLGAVPDGIGRVEVRKVGLNLTARRDDGTAIVLPPLTKGPDGTPVTPTDADPNTFDAYCAISPAESPRLAVLNFHDVVVDPCWILGKCPKALAPSHVVLRSVRATTAAVAWTPADDAAVSGYAVTLSGRSKAIQTATNSVKLSGLEPETDYTGTIRSISRDETAPDSDPVPFSFRTPVSPTSPVPRPADPQPGDIKATSATIRWNLPLGPTQGFVVETPAGPVPVEYTTPELELTGLQPDTAYEIPVRNVNLDDSLSAPLVIKFRTLALPGGPTTVGYTAAGTLKVSTLVSGSLPLKGSASLTFGAPTPQRAVTGTLNLGQSQGRLVALGYLPVTAKVSLVSVGTAAGALDGAALSLNQKVRVKVLEAKLFGAIPLAAGNTCQAKDLTDLALKSSGAFTPATGGPLSATFKISDLNGCGLFNGLVSPLTAGGGNTIAVNLASAAPASS